MEGGGDYRSSAPKQPVPQIPAEYDDLYMENGSYASQRDFSSSINRQMKVPNRLSVDGKNLHDLEVENMRANATAGRFTSAGMAVPDKITVAGAGVRNPLEDPYDVMNASAENTGYVNITTPPRVLTVDERFPQLEVDEEATNSEAHAVTDIVKQRSVRSTTLPTELVEAPEAPLFYLERRIEELERRQQIIARRDMVTYPLLAVYLLYKLFNWIMDR